MNKPTSKIICGDALEEMRKMPSSIFDLIVTSPPYNLAEGMETKVGLRIGHKGSKWSKQTSGPGWSIGYDEYQDNLSYPEYMEWQREILKECFRLLPATGAIFYNHKPRIVGGVARFPRNLVKDLPVRQEIIWYRKSGFNASTTAFCPMSERILIIAKPKFRLKNKAVSMFGDVWTITPEIGTDHPAPFPLELPRRILSACDGQRVLDPFCGSATTGAACVEFERDFTGIELSAHWAEYGRRRIARMNGIPCDLPQRIVERDYPLFEGI